MFHRESPRRQPPMSLPWKIFLSSAVVIAAVSALTLAVTARTGEQATDAALARELRATRAHVRSVLEARERGLEASAQVFVRQPTFRAAIGNAQTGRAALFDQAREGVRRIGASTVQIANARGVRLVRSDDSAAAPDTLARSALLARALAGRRAAGATVIHDTVLHQAIAIPVEGAQTRVGGVVVTTKVIDDSLARAISSATSNHVVFFALDTAGRPRISGSSMQRTEALTRFLDERAPIWAAADAGSPSRSGTQPATDSIAEVTYTGLTLGDTRWAATGTALRSAGGTALGGFVVLRSLDEEMGAFTQLQRFTVAAGAGALVLALAVSLLFGRTMSRRLGTIEAAARRAANGDYAADVPTRGRDEISRVAESVRAMLVDVREQRELVEFLAADTRRTIPPAHAPDLPTVHVNGDGLRPGHKLAGRYEIIELVGSGRVGKVYRAVDLELAEPVAVKTLRQQLANDSAALARLNAELRIARRISHRNVLRTHDLGEADGSHFVTMEYVAGTSVRALLTERGRLPVHAALPIARQLCRALEVAHGQGIIHRDLKPDNLVVTPDGVLKVTDFGIGRLLTRSHGSTQPGTVLGTPEYMAPEQLRGDDVDARADLYSAGVVIYECLTGRTPYTAESATESLSPSLEQSPVPPHEIVPDIPRWLSDVVLSALQRDRGKRPKSAGEMLRQLRESRP